MTQYYLSQISELFQVGTTEEAMSPELWEMYLTTIEHLPVEGKITHEFYETPSSEGGEKIIMWISDDDGDVIAELTVTPTKKTGLIY